jgi:5'-3' exonuclease
LELYKDTTIAIDAEALLYKFVYESADDPLYRISLGRFIKFIITYLNNNILPVFVFDGKPPEIKHSITVKRREKREQSKLRKQELTEQLDNKIKSSVSILATKEESELIDKINKEDRNNPNVSYEYRIMCKKLLTNLGIPIINTCCEAEVYCVKMLTTGMVDYIYSNDSDIIAYIVAQFIKRPELIHIEQHFKVIMDNREQSKYRISEFIEYDVHKILKMFGMGPEQFLMFCSMSGNDYGVNSTSFSPPFYTRKMTAFEYAKQYDTSNFSELDDTYIKCYNQFLNPDDSIKGEELKLKTDIYISKYAAVTTITVSRPTLNFLTEENIAELNIMSKNLNIISIILALDAYSSKNLLAYDYASVIAIIYRQ